MEAVYIKYYLKKCGCEQELKNRVADDSGLDLTGNSFTRCKASEQSLCER